MKTQPGAILRFLRLSQCGEPVRKNSRATENGNSFTATKQQRLNSLTVTATAFLFAFPTANNNDKEDGNGTS